MSLQRSSYLCESLEPRRLLTAPPVLDWSSYLGSSGNDGGFAVALDASGNAWVTGFTDSPAWAQGGFDTSYNGNGDAFVAKINSNGTLAWTSYLGGSSADESLDIAIDSAGNALVIGNTSSSGWVNGGFDTVFGGGSGADAFVAKITANGSLAWSTYLGGLGSESGRGIAIDAEDDVWVTGVTSSASWATNGFDTSYGGGEDAFVARISSSGSLDWSSYLGGSESDGGSDIDTDESGNAWITGSTASQNWVSGGYDTTFGGSTDGFLAKVNPNGDLDWTTYLGGSEIDAANGIAIDNDGNALVVGMEKPRFEQIADAFARKIYSTGALAWNRYLGGNNYDVARSVAIDSSNNAWVAGLTASTDWVTGGFDTVFGGGGRDTFVASVSESGNVLWSSYLGGSRNEEGNYVGIDIDDDDHAWVTSYTESTDLASGGFDTVFGGASDGFVAKIGPAHIGTDSPASFVMSD